MFIKQETFSLSAGQMDDEATERHECYVFNPKLMKRFNDGTCEHCCKWLTTECNKIDEFVDDIEALDDCD